MGVGIIWTIPVHAAHAVLMALLLRARLSVRRVRPPGTALLVCALAFGEFVVDEAVRVPFVAAAGLFTAMNAVFALIAFGGPAALRVFWSAAGCAAIFVSRLAASGIIMGSGIGARLDMPSFWPDFAVMLLQILAAAACMLPLFVPRAPSIALPSGIADACAAVCTVGATLSGWLSYAAVRDPSPSLCAACVGLGALTEAFALVMQLLGHYYARQNRLQAAFARAQSEEKARRKRYELVRRWHHDEKQHLAVLDALARNEDFAGVRRYIGELADQFMADGPGTVTENACLDALLAEKAAVCRSSGIAFRCHIEDAECLSLTGPQISALFGNALDNAVEACQKLDPSRYPFVEITLFRQDGFLKLSVVNSSAGEYAWKEGRLATKKRKKDMELVLGR